MKVYRYRDFIRASSVVFEQIKNGEEIYLEDSTGMRMKFELAKDVEHIEKPNYYDNRQLKNGGWRLLKKGEQVPWMEGHICIGHKYIDINGVAVRTNIVIPDIYGNPWLKADGTLSDTLCYEEPRYDGPEHAFRREQIRNGELA